MARYDAIGVGPGLGTGSVEAMRSLLEAAEGKAVVIDADGLNMLSQMGDRRVLLRRLGVAGPVVLTPHAMEFERLFGKYADAADRQRAQRELSRETNCAIVYKGHRTQITGVEGEMYVNTTGNPGMATAGSGDVLTGMMLSILSQNKDNQLNAAMCAV